tara:strand:+ start:91 stop:393 length:303 start_codon:yes stop_codon:yes gene_type:complete
MALDFECDSKDMDQRTADIVETVEQIYELVIDHSPQISTEDDSSEIEMRCTEAFTKALAVIQIITGICRCEASEALDHVIERAAKREKEIEKLNQQFKKS